VATGAFHVSAGTYLFVFYLGYCKNLPDRHPALWQKDYLEGNMEMVSEKRIRRFEILHLRCDSRIKKLPLTKGENPLLMAIQYPRSE
jgi:hypothetical protein